MTVQKTTSKSVYIGDGITKVFPITFEVGKTDYIHVYVREGIEGLIETKNFSVEDNNVVYPVKGDALAENNSIVITRELSFKQEMNLVNQGPFFAEDIEKAFDEVTMMIQQVNENVGRALTVEVDSTENPNDVIGQIFDARNLTQELASEATASAAASLQSEQNAKSSETISSRNKTATDENRSSVENAKSQVDTLLSQIIEHEANALTYKNNAMASAAQASEYEESARANAASANGSASLAVQKASEVTEVNRQIFVNRDEAINQIGSAKSDAISSISADKTAAATSASNALAEADRAKREADRAEEEVSKVDMSNYYSKSEVDSKVGDVANAVSNRIDEIESNVADALSVVAQGEGYIRYSNGTQIVWGETTANWSGGDRVTIEVPFVDNYTVQATTCQQTGVNGIAGYIVNQTPTSFSIFTNQGATTNTKYLCVGRWK